MTDLMLGQKGISDKVYNIRGNAWQIADSAFGSVLNPKDNDYQVGDIIVFSREAFKSDKEKGIPEQDQHVGIITGFDQNTKEPLVTHYVPHKGADGKREATTFTRQPLSKTSYNSGNISVPYRPSKIIRLNIHSNKNTPNYTTNPALRKADRNWIYENENYGDNVNFAIRGLNQIQDFEKKYQLTPSEDMDLKFATLAMLGLESDFGGSKRSFIRGFFPEATNIVKELKRGQFDLPSVGYGSIKPEIFFQNTNFPDLDKALKEKKITKQQYYKETYDRLAKLRQFGNAPLTGYLYNFRFDQKFKPITRQSYQGTLANYGGFDTRGVGQNIYNDAQLIYSSLVGLRKKYPNLSAKELVSKIRGSQLNDADSKKYDELFQSFVEGKYRQSTLGKFLQSLQKYRDLANMGQRQLKSKVARAVVPGANFKAAITDFTQDREDINEDFLSDSEYNALVDVVSQAVNNNKRTLGYSSDKTFQNYTPEGQALSGGTGGFMKSITKNLTDPYTKLQNMLGQASITEDADNYYVEDTYDFNNFGSLNNYKQGFVRNPQPYAILRSMGTTIGSAPGVGRKVKIKIPKTLIKKNTRGLAPAKIITK